MTTPWTIVEYTGLDGLERLEPDWTRLVAAMPDAGFQHLYETHASSLANLPSEFGAFCCLALSDGTRVRAICLVEPHEHPIFRVFKSPVWGLLKGLEDIPRDVICPPDAEAEAALFPCVVEHLRRVHPGRRWLVLTRMLEGSVALRCLRHFDARRYYADRDGAAHIVDCDRSFADLTSRLSRKFRANLRSAHNRLAKLPDVRFERTVDPAGLGAAFERLLEVEASGWKGEERTAIAPRPNHLAFYRAWVASLGVSGRAEFNELRSGDTCIASTFCVRVDQECAVMNIGYDERFAKVAPGHLVLERIFRQYCEDSTVKRVSLVSGYKWNAVWQPEVVGSYNVYIGIGGLGARVRMVFLRMKFWYWPVAKRWLQRTAAGARIARLVSRR
jgi:hypothetical protein